MFTFMVDMCMYEMTQQVLSVILLLLLHKKTRLISISIFTFCSVGAVNVQWLNRRAHTCTCSCILLTEETVLLLSVHVQSSAYPSADIIWVFTCTVTTNRGVNDGLVSDCAERGVSHLHHGQHSTATNYSYKNDHKHQTVSTKLYIIS